MKRRQSQGDIGTWMLCEMESFLGAVGNGKKHEKNFKKFKKTIDK